LVELFGLLLEEFDGIQIGMISSFMLYAKKFIYALLIGNIPSLSIFYYYLFRGADNMGEFDWVLTFLLNNLSYKLFTVVELGITRGFYQHITESNTCSFGLRCKRIYRAILKDV